MATTNRASFNEATEEFYLHLIDMDAGQEVYLKGRRFVKGSDGGIHLHSNQLPLDAFDFLNEAIPQLRAIGAFLDELERYWL